MPIAAQYEGAGHSSAKEKPHMSENAQTPLAMNVCDFNPWPWQSDTQAFCKKIGFKSGGGITKLRMPCEAIRR